MLILHIWSTRGRHHRRSGGGQARHTREVSRRGSGWHLRRYRRNCARRGIIARLWCRCRIGNSDRSIRLRLVARGHRRICGIVERHRRSDVHDRRRLGLGVVRRIRTHRSIRHAVLRYLRRHASKRSLVKRVRIEGLRSARGIVRIRSRRLHVPAPTASRVRREGGGRRWGMPTNVPVLKVSVAAGGTRRVTILALAGARCAVPPPRTRPILMPLRPIPGGGLLVLFPLRKVPTPLSLPLPLPAMVLVEATRGSARFLVTLP